MIERFENGELISEKEWISHIEELEKKSNKSTKEEVKQAIVDAVKKRIPKKQFGVFFSGGVDSTLLAFICKQNIEESEKQSRISQIPQKSALNAVGKSDYSKPFNADFVCYSVGLKNSPDIVIGKEVAKILGLKLVQKTFTLEELHELFKKTCKILKNPDILSVGVGAVIIAAAELGKKDGIDTFFGGLGSEEIFAGYERHSKADDVHAECWRGLKSMWPRDFSRDFDVATAMKIKVLIPFLDDNLIIKAMGIPGKRKVSDTQRKIILREIAEEIGLPKQFAWREKKAAQYGSWFDKAMDKLATQHGFSTKMKYLGSLAT